jgi:co-chaperonin GroES (HSP10)
LLIAKNPELMRMRNNEVLVRGYRAKSASGIILPKGLCEDEIPVAEIIARGPNVADDLNDGDFVLVGRLHFDSLRFEHGPADDRNVYSIVEDAGIMAVMNDAMESINVSEEDTPRGGKVLRLVK